MLDNAIFLENLRLGNITPGTIGQGALDIGAALVKPVTLPLSKGQTTEAIVRGGLEVVSLPFTGWTKAGRAKKAADALKAVEAAEALKASDALKTAEASRAADAANGVKMESGVSKQPVDGIHIEGQPAKIDTGGQQQNRTQTREGEIERPPEPDDVLVYRGTNRGAENMAYDETGHLLSDAGINEYMSNGSLKGAYDSSNAAHKKWIDIWGTEDQYVQAHGAFGTELKPAFGLDKTFISVTTDPAQAAYFAGDGVIYSGRVPRQSLLEQTLKGAGESEYLLTSGSDLLKPMK
jgi:hypothetical protein